MRAVVQRVSRAQVSVNGTVCARIGTGLLVLLGAAQDDTHEDAAFVARKLANLRVFEDAAGKMNLSVKDVGGSVLVVSQFTLLGECRKGNRPSFTQAAPPDAARPLVEKTCDLIRAEGLTVDVGVFGAVMEVELLNAGPVTIVLDSNKAVKE